MSARLLRSSIDPYAETTIPMLIGRSVPLPATIDHHVDFCHEPSQSSFVHCQHLPGCWPAPGCFSTPGAPVLSQHSTATERRTRSRPARWWRLRRVGIGAGWRCVRRVLGAARVAGRVGLWRRGRAARGCALRGRRGWLDPRRRWSMRVPNVPVAALLALVAAGKRHQVPVR